MKTNQFSNKPDISGFRGSVKYVGVTIFVGCFVFCVACQEVVAQDDWPDWLDRSTAAVLFVSSPDELVSCIRMTRLFESPGFSRIRELMIDPELGLVSEEQFEECVELLSKMGDTLSKLEEFGIVIHSLKGESISLSVLAKGDDRTLEWIENHFRQHANSTVDFLSLFEQPLTAKKDLSEGRGNDIAAPSDWISGIITERKGEWLVFSSQQSDHIALIGAMGASGPKASLSSSRKFLTIKSIFDSIPNRGSQVFVYADPEQCNSYWMPRLDEKMREAMHFDEMPGMGFLISLNRSVMNDQRDSTKKIPPITFDGVVTFTKPQIGYGKRLTTYRPLGELPMLPFDVVELSAFSFDPIEKHKVDTEIYDSIHGEGALSKILKPDDVEFKDIEYNVWYRHGNLEQWNALSIEHIRSQNAANRLFDESIQASNRRQKQFPLVSSECRQGRLFARSDESEIRRAMFQEDITQEQAEASFEMGFRSDAFFLNDDFRIVGSKLSISDFLEASSGGNVNRIVEMTKELPECPQNPFRINFHGSLYWQPEQFEKRRAKNKYSSVGKMLEYYYHRTPDKFGSRLDVESRDDAKAVMASIAWRLLAENFGNILTMYSFDSGNLRIFGAVYPESKMSKSSK